MNENKYISEYQIGCSKIYSRPFKIKSKIISDLGFLSCKKLEFGTGSGYNWGFLSCKTLEFDTELWWYWGFLTCKTLIRIWYLVRIRLGLRLLKWYTKVSYQVKWSWTFKLMLPNLNVNSSGIDFELLAYYHMIRNFNPCHAILLYS